MLQEMASHWWLVLLRGILSIIFGVVALLNPGLTAVSLAYVFGAYAIVDGIAAIITAVLGDKVMQNRLILGLEGVLGVIIGIIAVVFPTWTVVVFLQVIAIWAFVTGLFEIVGGLRARNWWLGLAGLLSIIFGVYFFLFPGAGALVLLTVIGIYAIIFGILFVILSFRIRSLAPAT